MPRLQLSTVPPEQAEADLLVLPVAAGPDGPAATGPTGAVLARLGADLAELGRVAGFAGRLDDALLLPSYGALAAPAVLLVGVGPDAERDPETLRRAAAVAVAGAGRAATVAACLHEAGDGPAAVAAVAEGFLLAAYRFQRHRSEPEPGLAAVTLLAGPGAAGGAERALRRAERAAEATLLTRDLVNEPASVLNPATMAAEAVRVAGRSGLEHRVLEADELRRGGFGGVLAVGGGSAVPPRMVELRWRPADARRHVALVGKGVTFDSGGLDLKRGKDMDGMKDDMAGAATVLGVMSALAGLAVPVAVTGVLPLVENMPGGAAMRAGDVLRARNGVAVEVTNTDAEGRLILADGLSLAAEARPDAIVDLATLTGSAVAGLGPGVTAVMGNHAGLAAELLAAARDAGEPACQLPLVEDYRRFLDSDVADLVNATNEPGDSIQAGLFLREFVAGLPWVHLDIAGPATAKEARYHTPKGATGCMVRTLLGFLEGSGEPGTGAPENLEGSGEPG